MRMGGGGQEWGWCALRRGGGGQCVVRPGEESGQTTTDPGLLEEEAGKNPTMRRKVITGKGFLSRPDGGSEADSFSTQKRDF